MTMDASSVSRIRDIFDDAQRSMQSHKLCVRKLSNIINSMPSSDDDLSQQNGKVTTPAFNYFLYGCIDRILLHTGSTNAVIDRLVSFIGAYLSVVDEQMLLLTMQHMCSRLRSTNKLVRQRVCQLVCSSLQSLSESNTELSCELFSELSEHLSQRLKDKVAIVRIWAVKALKFLQAPEDDRDVPTLELKRCMRSDTSYLVRIAAVETLILTDCNKNDLCGRLKDVHSEVRVAVLRRLKEETDIRQFSTQMRAEILRSALEDRDIEVKAAVLGLIWKWLGSVENGNSVSKFLSLLNPIENEDAVLLVGAVIVEELVKSETTAVPEGHTKLKRALKESIGNWESISPASLTPSDVMWVYIRCSYARQFLPVLPASDLCDSLLPDAFILCKVLSEVKATLIDPSKHHSKSSGIKKTQLVLKYLLSTSTLLIGCTDISGLSQLVNECVDSFLNTSISMPWDGIEAALRSYTELHPHTSVSLQDSPRELSHHTVMGLIKHIQSEAAKLVEETIDKDSLMLKHLHAITQRCLQITQWALQQELSHVARTVPSTVHRDDDGSGDGVRDMLLKEMVPYILDALQQPVYTLRSLGLSCLGLVCLIDCSLCDVYRRIVLQVACGDFEDEGIRGQALQTLTDLAIMHREKYSQDSDLSNLLLRMQESGEPESMLIAAESAAKLLHAGILDEPKLFANLLKFFFLTESVPSATTSSSLTADPVSGELDEETIEQEYQRRVFLANCSRMQQVLSIFFHVFTTTDVVADRVVSESIPQLVNDMTNEIKDGTVDAPSLSKILKHLFSLCERKVTTVATTTTTTTGGDNSYNGDVNSIVPSSDVPSSNAAEVVASTEHSKLTMLSLCQATAAAAISRELLKLGQSKVEKSIGKEFIKLLSNLSLETWVDSFDVSSIVRLVDTIMLCTSRLMDKTSTKSLQQLMTLCMKINKQQLPTVDRYDHPHHIHINPLYIHHSMYDVSLR